MRVRRIYRGLARALRSRRIPSWLTGEGSFDADWYRRRYPDVAASGADPLRHYWRHGRFQRRFPGPGIRLVDLAREHPRSFRGPGFEKVKRARVRFAPRRRGKMIEVPRGRRIDGSVAVMIHAFYPDVLRPILRSLRPLRRDATFLISVCTPEAAATVEAMVTKILGRDARRIVMIVPNRGRNFAPLVCGFGNEVLRHDYLLHLHTKKSLYVGYERTEWRDFLLESLAGRSIRPILRIFADDSEIGVVQPAAFREMPPWVSHWLSNQRHGRALFERLGMDPRRVEGIVDYPIGGMFWARVDAIAPLFRCGLTLDDFEEEHGQLDGALPHAIERTITELARWRGYRYVEVIPGARHWRLDWSSRNVGEFGVIDRQVVRRRLEACELVTVDIFDTLILRPAIEPAALQFYAARSVAPDTGTAVKMLESRVGAERQIRESGSHAGDVTLDEVYAALPAEFAAMRDQETAIESRVAIPRRWLIDDLRSIRDKGVRLVAVTDTTLPRRVVEELLDQVGAGDLFDDLYVSNDRLARKDTGTVWPLVERNEGVEPKNWIHIGDNEHSDIQTANDRGIGNVHLPAPRTVAHFYEMDEAADPADWSTNVVLGLSAASLFHGTMIDDRDDAFGYAVLGPILASFVGCLMERRRTSPDEKMLLFARDCHLVHRAALRFGIDCGYFRVSRRTALAVAQAGGVDAGIIVDAGEFTGRLGDLVEARTGFRPTGREFEVEVELPRDRRKVIAAIETTAEELVEHGRARLEGLRRYLTQLGITDDDRLCAVDLGYSATTQRCLQRVLPNPMHGIYCVTTPRAADASAVGWFGDGVEFTKGNWFLDNSLLIESLLSAVEGSAVDYGPDGTPILGPVPRVDAERIAHVQEAALRFLDDLVTMFGPAVFDDPVDPACVMGWVDGIPTRFLPDATVIFNAMRIENSFVGRPDDDASVTA